MFSWYNHCVDTVCVLSCFSCVQLLCDPVDCSLPGSSVHGDSPGDLADPGIEPASLMSPALVGGFFTNSATLDTSQLTINRDQTTDTTEYKNVREY